jgi:hypothetical protein
MDVIEPRQPPVISRQLHNALQARFREHGLSVREYPELMPLIRQFLSGQRSRATLIAGLQRLLFRHAAKIPRKGARGGYDCIGSADDRLGWLIDDLMSILDCARNTAEQQAAKNRS